MLIFLLIASYVSAGDVEASNTDRPVALSGFGHLDASLQTRRRQVSSRRIAPAPSSELPYDPTKEYGRGWNHRIEQWAAHAFMPYRGTIRKLDAALNVEYTKEVVKSTRDFSEALRLTASVSAGGWGFKFKYQHASERQISMSSRDALFIMHASKDLGVEGWRYAQVPPLREEAKNALCDHGAFTPEKFEDTYGTYYVQGVRKATALDIYIKVNTETTDESKKVSHALEAGWSGFGFHVGGGFSFANALREAYSTHKMKVTATASGVDRDWIPRPTIDNLDQVIKEYEEVSARGSGIALTLSRYDDHPDYIKIKNECGHTFDSAEREEYWEDKYVDVAVEARLLAEEALNGNLDECGQEVALKGFSLLDELVETPEDQLNAQGYFAALGKLNKLHDQWTETCDKGPEQLKLTYGLCLDTPAGDKDGGKVQVWGCGKHNTNQHFNYYAKSKQIKATNGNCLGTREDHNGALVKMLPCNENEEDQQWSYDERTGLFRHGKGRCLDGTERKTNGGKVWLWSCNENNKNQKWQILDGTDCYPGESKQGPAHARFCERDQTTCSHGKSAKIYEEAVLTTNFPQDHCDSLGLDKVENEKQCKAACESRYGSFSAGEWDYAPGCFVVVAGEHTNNCHWNKKSDASRDNMHTRPVCFRLAESGHNGREMCESCDDGFYLQKKEASSRTYRQCTSAKCSCNVGEQYAYTGENGGGKCHANLRYGIFGRNGHDWSTSQCKSCPHDRDIMVFNAPHELGTNRFCLRRYGFLVFDDENYEGGANSLPRNQDVADRYWIWMRSLIVYPGYCVEFKEWPDRGEWGVFCNCHHHQINDQRPIGFRHFHNFKGGWRKVLRHRCSSGSIQWMNPGGHEAKQATANDGVRATHTDLQLHWRQALGGMNSRTHEPNEMDGECHGCRGHG